MTTSALKLSNQVTLAVGCVAGGAGASLTLASATTGSHDDSPSWHVLFDSAPAVQAVGATVAVAVSLLRVSAVSRLLTTLIAIIVLVSTLAGTSGDAAVLGYVSSILAGVILGGLAGWTIAVAPHLEWAPAALAVGTVIGVMLREPLYDPFVIYSGGDQPTPTISVDSVSTALLFVSIVVATGLNPTVQQALSPAVGPEEDSRVHRVDTVAGVLLAVMAVVVIWWYTATVRSHAASVNEWYPAYLQVLLILAVAVMQGARGGALLVIAAAWTASRSGETAWLPDSRAWLLLAVVGIVAGALLGWRSGRPVIGVAVLAVCAATYLLIRPPFAEVYSAATLFVAPGAAAFALAGVLRGTRPVIAVAAIAFAGPAFWMFAPRSVFVTITTIGSGDSRVRAVNYEFVSPTLFVAAKVAVPMIIAIALCALVLVVIERRRNHVVPAPVAE